MKYRQSTLHAESDAYSVQSQCRADSGFRGTRVPFTPPVPIYTPGSNEVIMVKCLTQEHNTLATTVRLELANM